MFGTFVIRSGTRLQGSIRVQAIRLVDCCSRGDDAHRALNVEQQRLRPCLRLRFFEGVSYGQSVSHVSLTIIWALLAIPDSVYNWILNFFRDHADCTKFAGIISAVANIYAGVIQGSATGPASYIVTVTDLRCLYTRQTRYLNSPMTPVWLYRPPEQTRVMMR